MTINDWLRVGHAKLETAGIATARLDVLVLLEDVLNTNRAQLLAHSDLLLTHEQLQKLQKLVARRACHEPLAYIRNKTEFYGYAFYVDGRVLEPRPESETMIELLKKLPLGAKRRMIIDAGTGSGALAITAKLEVPQAEVIAIDIDPGCLSVAKRNAKQLGVKIAFMQSDLLEAIPKKYELITRDLILLCNLPYVPDNFQINTAATHEPKLAIFGGHDGLEVYRKLFDQLQEQNIRPQYILTEALPPQHETLAVVAKTAGFVLDQSEDFVQVFRTTAGNSAL